ncbi:hypothetical protein QY882_10430 [Latilactobacillus sakei]
MTLSNAMLAIQQWLVLAGVLQDYPSQLTTEEQQKWQTSIDTIKHMYAAI